MNDVTQFQNLLPTYERPLTALDIRAQVNVIQEVLRDVMVAGVHYGYPPGTEPKNEEEKKTKKPSLLKPGAELLCVVFRLDPQYEAQRTRLPMGHLEVVSTCTLYYIPNGKRVGSGMGSATTEESKHAYRWAGRVCPMCNAEAIIKSRFDDGWYCFDRKGGCKARFAADDPAIVRQEVGRIANPDLADQYNTVLKMGNKRSLVAGVLTATAASDMFDQDIEEINPEADWTDDDGVVHQGKPPRPAVQQPRSRSAAPAAASKASRTEEPGAGAAGAAPDQPKKNGNGDEDAPLTPGARQTLENALKRAGRTDADLQGAGFPSINDMKYGRFNDAMTWVRAHPAAT